MLQNKKNSYNQKKVFNLSIFNIFNIIIKNIIINNDIFLNFHLFINKRFKFEFISNYDANCKINIYINFFIHLRNKKSAV